MSKKAPKAAAPAISAGAKMDSETERLVARLIMERAALLEQRAGTDGVLSYLRRGGSEKDD